MRWSYDCIEPVVDGVVEEARRIIRESRARLYEHEVGRFRVSYTARRGPAERRLFADLRRVMPEPFLGTIAEFSGDMRRGTP